MGVGFKEQWLARAEEYEKSQTKIADKLRTKIAKIILRRQTEEEAIRLYLQDHQEDVVDIINEVLQDIPEGLTAEQDQTFLNLIFKNTATDETAGPILKQDYDPEFRKILDNQRQLQRRLDQENLPSSFSTLLVAWGFPPPEDKKFKEAIRDCLQKEDFEEEQIIDLLNRLEFLIDQGFSMEHLQHQTVC
ncbi:hypothetical protein MYX82_05570 [Acidobacteria bacterium AH-259-D05]|nr:hypothetical protein [Acidobacteria bacterium AH-259-D05]